MKDSEDDDDVIYVVCHQQPLLVEASVTWARGFYSDSILPGLRPWGGGLGCQEQRPP